MASRNTQPLSKERREEPRAPQTSSTASFSRSQLLFNRELSLIEFFRRVLEEALDQTQPLLERLKFLSIFYSNLDEFFMIRVSGLKEKAESAGKDLSPDGLTAGEQLQAIRERLLPLVAEQMRCLREEVLPQLAAQGIVVAPYGALSEEERARLEAFFMKNVLPVLTPLAVDPAHPFPYISNLSLNLGLMVEPVREHGITRSLTGKVEPRFVRIKVPPILPRLIRVDEADTKFILLEELIAANTATLFPRMKVGTSHSFRVTRDADIEIREDEADDLLRSVEQSLRKRRFGTAVRLEVSETMPAEMVNYLVNSLGLAEADVYRLDGALSIPGFMPLYDLPRADLKDKPLRTSAASWLNHESVFEIIKQQDVLLHHPYTSYEAITEFIKTAAHDPDVLAIKMCLYRTGQNSPIPEALIEASEAGKQVTAIVELKARFDEENNIEWAKRLEQAGVHVVYGLLGLKTHCKVMQVVRREEDELRSYVHISTGNYNPATARVYTDMGLLTADEEIGADATDLFNFLTGYSRQKVYRQLLVAPVNLRERMLKLIERETEHAREGRPARIVAKINRLADTQIIRSLYEASQAGVSIDLIVRGVCMLRPGVVGLSETIRVRSIVGRLLEHSRAYYFANGGEEELYTGSADWMPRNFDRRVEVVAPVHDPELKKHLKDVVLAAYLRDNVKARILKSDGTYERVPVSAGEESFDAQLFFENSVNFKVLNSPGKQQ
ncbi:MAG TPA: polyphosphate kinase 1 [Pyrinomonadaceae bacterium]|jgi:polyphosphate kinase